MSGCWNVKSDERPTFRELIRPLECLQFTEKKIEESVHSYFVLEVN